MAKNAQAKSFIKLQLIKIDWQNKVWFTKFMPLYDLIDVIARTDKISIKDFISYLLVPKFYAL